jgi:ribosome-associated protein
MICSGESARQLDAISDEITHNLKKQGEKPIYHEGSADSGWMLVDYGNVLVHIFSLEKREFYQLDELWNQAVSVLRIQ